MKEALMKRLFLAIAVMLMAVPVCMAEEGRQEGGLFSEGSFLSDTISSITDKIGKVTSGEEKIISDDAKGMGGDGSDYEPDPLGRSRSGQDKRL
jgi:hypothetical protein